MSTMIPIFTDTMRVLVRKTAVSKTTFSDFVKTPFTPFSFELWMVVIAQYFLSSLVVYWLERGVNEDDFPNETVGGNIGESAFKGLMAAFGGGLLLGPKTWPGKIIMTGLTLSNMVFMTIYGGYVTTALVASRLSTAEGPMTSFRDGYDRGLTFCVYAFTVPFIEAKWPNLKIKSVGAGGKVYELFDKLTEGECDGSLIIDNWWYAAQHGKYSSDVSPLWDTLYSTWKADDPEGWRRFHCDDKIFPLPSSEIIWSIGNGIPIREELARPFSLAINSVQEDPNLKYSVWEAEYKNKFVPAASGCSTEAASSSSAEEQTSADLTDGVGATLLSVFFTVGGIVWHLVSRFVSRSKIMGVVDEVAVDQEKAAGNSDSDQSVHARLAQMEKSLLAAIERIPPESRAGAVRSLDQGLDSCNSLDLGVVSRS